MNVILDVGNTLVKVGLFEHRQLIHHEQVEPEKITHFLSQHQIEHILVSDVRGIADTFLKPLTQNYSIIFLDYQTPLPVKNLYKTPQTLGTDRIAGAIGAYFSAPNQNHLVMDAGTSLTYDFIDKNGNYWGGHISLGLRMRFRALAHFTGKLPEIEFTTQQIPTVGQTTEEAILSGVIHGILGEVAYVLENYRQKFGEFQLSLCGGDANFFEKQIKASIFANPNLVLLGLNEILIYHLKSL